ncbi:MAG: hypothetical protein HY883_06560 [Deltaproteobacteria bacterium]|nr:hypothetical protein [Deltaproteobacteria bacterium]
MSQERGRLVREMAALARRKRNLESELKDIEKEMHSAGRRVFERKKGAGKSKEGEAFRIVAIEY